MLKSALWGKRSLRKSVCWYTGRLACPRPMQTVMENKRSYKELQLVQHLLISDLPLDTSYTPEYSLCSAVLWYRCYYKTSPFKLKLKFEEVKLPNWGHKVHRWGDFQAIYPGGKDYWRNISLLAIFLRTEWSWLWLLGFGETIEHSGSEICCWLVFAIGTSLQ